MALKIAFVVPGRFHSFDLARGLIARGNDVTIFTNYPAQAGPRFGLPPSCFRSYLAHGVASRAVAATKSVALGRRFERVGHQMFGRWAARQIARESWDAIYCWSGVAEEVLRAPCPPGTVRLLMRGSAHISVQRQLLRDEEARVSVPLDQPSDWIVERERREYDLADHIIVLSSFAKQSFIDEGVPAEKITMNSLGVQVDTFRPSSEAVAERAARIRRGDPLTVLFVGALSYRKGLWDLARVIASMDPDRFRFVLVGAVLPEAEALSRSLPPEVQVMGKIPQADLPKIYTTGDVFLFPTIEDGFAVVLAQAKAAGLPIITTPNGAGFDLVQSERDGWIVPIRDADEMVARLQWCDANRDALARTVERGAQHVHSRAWADVASDFEDIVRARKNRSRGALAHV